MADLKLEGADLKKMVKLGKKRPLSFGFCPGPKNDHAFLIDRRKGPEMLGKLARQEGEGKKVAFGTFEVKGRVMEMTCGRTVPQMAKTIKKYLKSQKALVNVVILDADGNTLESDVEDLPDDPTMEDTPEEQAAAAEEQAAEAQAAAAPETQTQEAPGEAEAPVDAAALAARLKALQPAIAAVGGDTADKLKKVVAGAVAQIKSSAFEQADTSITALENAVAKLGQAVAPTEEAAQEAAPAAPDFRALAARAKALQGTIADVAEPAKGKLMAALSGAAQNIKDRNHDTADAMLGKIEAALNKMMAAVSDARDANGDSSKWDAALARLQPAVDKAIADKRGDLGAINTAFGFAKDQAADGNYDSALKAAGKVAELLKQAASMETTAAAQEAADVTPEGLVKLRVAWIETRMGMHKEIEGLKAAIDDATKNIEGMEEVSSKSQVLFDYIGDIDTELEQTLQQMVDAKDEDSLAKLKTSALQIVDTYKGALDSDFFKAVDENGFVKTNIRSSALGSLQKVTAALAA